MDAFSYLSILILEQVLGLDRRADDIALREGWAVAELSERVSGRCAALARGVSQPRRRL